MWSEQKSTRKDCLLAIEHLTNHSSYSPVLTCYHYGENSEECQLKFITQHTISWSDARSKLNLYDNNDILPKSYTKSSFNREYSSKKKELAKLKKLYKKENSYENKRLLRAAYSALIEKACNVDPIHTSSTPEMIGIHSEKFDPNKNPELSKLNDLIEDYKDEIAEKDQEKAPFGAYLKDYQKKKAKEIKKGEKTPKTGIFQDPVEHSAEYSAKQNQESEIGSNGALHFSNLIPIRILPNECYRIIVDDMLETLPLDSLAICAKDGPFSPTCKRAREQQKKDVPPPKSKKNNSYEFFAQ